MLSSSSSSTFPHKMRIRPFVEISGDETQWSQANRFNDQEHSRWEPVNQRKNTHTSNSNDFESQELRNARAVATTLAPAQETNPLVSGAVQIPSALKPSVPRPGRSASRLPARSLQNWEVEDLVLLATVDGTIHARDRRTGAARWALQAEDPMIETIYHDREGTTRAKMSDRPNGIWIVEPSQDGSLYYYIPGSPGVQRLGVTVKQLEQDPSAYVAEEPSFTYTASRKSTIYEVDARSGKIVKLFNTPDSAVLEQSRCRRVGPFESPEDDSCVATGTIILVRVEYLVQVADSDTGEAICTIKYLEWAPNSRDNDLHNQYHTAKDNRYIYSEHNGRARALDHDENGAKQGFIQDFSSPVARVFDVARSINHTSTNTPMVLLPQPNAPLPRPEEDFVFVNCTESGSWFALSQDQYPMIAHAPKPTGSLRDMENALDRIRSPSDPLIKGSLVGVHSLSNPESLEYLQPRFRLLDSPSTRLSIDAPAYNVEDNRSWGVVETKQTWSDRVNLYKAIATIAIFVLTIAGVSRYRLQPSARLVDDTPRNDEVSAIEIPELQKEIVVGKEDTQTEKEIPRLVTVDLAQVEEAAKENSGEQVPTTLERSTSDHRSVLICVWFASR